MASCTLPAIAHMHGRIRGGHFVVVHRWTATHLVLADPSTGLRIVSRKSFCRRSSGYILIVDRHTAAETTCC
jgi:ABC-type bacteriocin/lantibiotic exporter with double-glycine peptidase domain